MKVLWERGPSTVSEIQNFPAADVTLASSTIRSLLGIHEDKGYVETTMRGKARVYEALFDSAEARGSVARYVIDRFFNGSAHELVLGF